MKTFLFIVLIVEMFIVSGWNTESAPAQTKTWPYLKYYFPYRVQSPVDIPLADVKRIKLGVDPLKIHFPLNPSKEITRIENTGYYLEVSLPHEVEDRPYLTGGPLMTNKYIFEQLHFHWGPEGERGSEHLVNGRGFPTEVHVVFYNKIYGSLKKAINYPDGVAVVAFFGEFAAKNIDNSGLNPLIKKLSKVIEPGTSTTSSFKIEFFFTRNVFKRGTYYTFPGSLTTPAFPECVTWIVCSRPFYISTTQLEAFRRLRATNGTYLRSNIRQVQDFNGRPLISPLD